MAITIFFAFIKLKIPNSKFNQLNLQSNLDNQNYI